MSDLMAPLAAALAGRYRLERELGAGGMATVYLAQDLRHHRKVALKVLRDDLAAPVGGARFQREIAIAAQLQHPHILPLHESGEVEIASARVLFFVMPFVDGPSLRQHVAAVGALPIQAAVRLLIEIVDALAYAHAHGVVHRDIKPDNVMLSGRHALVTDFGVAKAIGEATDSQTVTTTGLALGTPAYMAPEQAAGERYVDHRADIYAVGVLAYELLAGVPPFAGLTAQQLLAAHLTATPAPIRATRPDVPDALDRIVLRCLAKDPADRWQSATALMAALEPLVAPSGTSARDSTRREHALRGRRILIGVTAGVVTLGAIIAGVMFLVDRSPPAVVIGRSTQLTSEDGLEIFPAISPDGNVVAYSAGNSARMRVYLRPVRGGRTLPLSTDTASVESQPQWAPDGDRILYLSRGGVWVASSLGGSSREVVMPAADHGVVSAAWSRTGDSIAVVRGDSLLVFSADGSRDRFVTAAREWHSCEWSPTRDQLACVSGNGSYVTLGESFGNLGPSAIVLVRLGDGSATSVTDSSGVALSPQWSADGARLFFVSNREGPRDVYVVSVGSDGRAHGPADRVTTGLDAQSIALDRKNTRLAYAVYREEGNLWSVPIPSRDQAPVTIERATRLTSGNQLIETVSASPDQRWLVFASNLAGSADIYRIPIKGGDPERLTSDPSDEFVPAVSPDGSELAYHSPRSGNRDIYVQRIGSTTAQRVTTSRVQACCALWSPDGHTLGFNEYLGEAGVFLVRRDAAGRWGQPKQRVAHGFSWAWSHDGSLIALTAGRRIRTTLPSERIELISPDSGAPRILYAAADTLRDPVVGQVIFTPDRSGVYFKSHDPMGHTSFWYEPLTGGRPTMLVLFDDLTRQSFRPNFAVGAGRFFFTIDDRQSDVWVAELTKR